MKNIKILIAILTVAFLLFSTSIAYAQELKVIVGIKNNSPNIEDQLQNITGLVQFSKIPNSKIIMLKVKSEYIDDVITNLNRLTWVKFVETSKRQRFSSIPYDNLAELKTSNWYGEIGGDELKSIANGRPVVVAVIDSGIDLNNPALSSRIFINSREVAGDGIDNDGNGFVDDVWGWDFGDSENNVQDGLGHGTEVSSIVVSLSKDAKILPIKINPANADFFETAALIRSIYYAISRGAKVINLSIAMQVQSPGVMEAIKDAYDRGIVIVTAAGNSGDRVSFPASMNQTIAVGSTDNEVRASFSPSGEALDVVAPGINLKTISIDGRITYVSGTSFSAAMVSAECANIISMNPNFSNREIKDIIQKGTIDLGEEGWDVEFGAGKINGEKLYSILTPKIILPDKPFYAFSKLYPLSVSINIPITTFSFLLIAVETPDHNFFWLDSYGWHDLSNGIGPFIQLGPQSNPQTSTLFGEGGYFMTLDLTNVPPGLYKWYTVLTDNTLSFLSPLSCSYMLIF